MTPHLLEAAKTLAEALRRENAALLSLDLNEATAMLGEKTAAMERFAAAAQRSDAPLIDAQTTREAALRLRALADDNKRLLEQAMQVQARVVGTIRLAALQQGTDRRYRRSGGQEKTQMVPMAIRADV